MINFETIIGIEVHASLNTKYKVFSNSLNSHTATMNTNINVCDLAHPGTLPIFNPEVIQKAIWLAYELNMTPNYQNICFDRKNYFYQDLPKGFQITQQYYPFALNGYIDIGYKKINIERFHLEEDTAKQININNIIELDYNRCGCPLIEIVSQPDIRNANEAVSYLQELIKILKFTNICDAKLEEGSLRADINISIRPFGSEKFGTKVEIKNLNSLSNVSKAIEFETQRQIALYLQNLEIEQETRRFDESTSSTISMRTKSNAIDYRYIYEPNIINYYLTDDEYKDILFHKPKSIQIIKKELINAKLNDDIIDLYLNNYDIYTLFEQLNNELNHPELISNWIINELIGNLNKSNISLNQFINTKYNTFKKLLEKIINEDLNGKQAKIVCNEIINSNNDIEKIIADNGLIQIKDKTILTNYLNKYINENNHLLLEYDSRPERVEKFFIGLLMKDTKGQANPNISIMILKELLNHGKKDK